MAVGGQIVPVSAGFRAASWHGLPVNGNVLPASEGIGVVSGGRWLVDGGSGAVRRVIRVVREGIGVVSGRSRGGNRDDGSGAEEIPSGEA